MKVKKVPMRKCIGCNEQKPKKALIRIVKNKEGEIAVDFTGKLNGRGAYLCHDIACLEKAKKKNALPRALDCSIDEEIYDKLQEELASDE